MTLPRVDHIGVVSHSIDDLVKSFMSMGFRVSTPAPLMARLADGRMVTMGQESAHVVFENFYIELSAPERHRPDNHLPPYLERFGPGVRIVALACGDADAAHRVLERTKLPLSPIQDSRRTIEIAGGQQARFRWFSTESGGDTLGALTCWVQQLTPELVFHPANRSTPSISDRVLAVLLDTRDKKSLESRLLPWSKVPLARTHSPWLQPVQESTAAHDDNSEGNLALGTVSALLFKCPDVAAYREFLARQGLNCTEKSGTLWVPVPGLPSLQLGFTENEQAE